MASSNEGGLRVGIAQMLSDDKPRCWRCNRLLAITLTRPWRMFCPRCKAQNGSEPVIVEWGVGEIKMDTELT